MEDEPEATKKCPLCDQQIAVSKFRMHDIGCSRQNYRCKECNMCVPKADQEDHEAEEHAIIECPNCSFKATKFNYKNHDEKCKSKPKECGFCQKTIGSSEWADHQVMCGNKTYMCA